MMKKLLLASVTMILVLCFVIPSAFAATDKEISKLFKMVDKANKTIENSVAKAIRTPQDDVDELLAMVDEITAPVFEYATSVSAKVACVDDFYWIDGHYVAIDPLRVVNVGTGTGGTK